MLEIRFAYGPPSTGDVQPTGNGSSTGSPPVWPTIGEDAILEMAFQEPFENPKRDTQIDTKYRTASWAVYLPVNDGNYITYLRFAMMSPRITDAIMTLA